MTLTSDRRGIVALVLLVLGGHALGAGAQAPARTPVPGTSSWVVEGAGRELDVKVSPHLGRDDAVWLRNSTHAIVVGPDFGSGTIEFDIAPMERGDFVGVTFHRESFAHHENLYLRLRQSGRFMALQYAPRTNGSSTWQLHPEFNRAVDWPRDAWTHVRLDVRGSSLTAYVGGAAEPVLRVPRLRLGLTGGGIALWARVNNDPEAWAAAISNLTITRGPDEPASPQGQAPRGYLREWRVSAPVAVSAGEPATLSSFEGVPARVLTADETGLVNVNGAYATRRGRFAVAARVTLHAAEAGVVRAGIGYSDDVTVFVNGQPVYQGVNGWESRAPEYASFVDARFEHAFLPLRAGDNELLLVVTDDQRFGWGFAVSLDDTTLASGGHAARDGDSGLVAPPDRAVVDGER